MDDPNLGILIKTNSNTSFAAQFSAPQRNMIMGKALETKRLVIYDEKVLPSRVGSAADFAIGIGSPSAILSSALSGAKVIYLTYDRMQNIPDRHRPILLTLGKNRCVFHGPDKIKKILLEYFSDNSEHKLLGDMSPILNMIDPFRDGQAHKRIAEYVSWYMQGLGNNLDIDSALFNASKRYAAKWGRDKVIKGLV